MNLLVISQYYYPEQFRINDICKEWVKRGHNVTVLTGIPNYPQGKFYKGYGLFKKRNEIHEGVNIIRIPIIPRGKKGITLILNYISFVISSFFFSKFTKKNFDKVFIYELSPITQAYAGIWYAKRAKVECCIYVMDLWPESIQLATGMSNKKILNIIGKMVDKIYMRCDKIFTSSESFINAIRARGQPDEKLIFWPQYAEEFYKPLEKATVPEIKNDKYFKIVFTGNIGQAQGLDIIIDVANKIKEKNILAKFYLIGDGRAKEMLQEQVTKQNLEQYVIFIEKKPAKEIPKYYAMCDMAFLSLKENEISEKILPAKLQSYMACGIPILGCVGGEAKKIIEDSKCGFYSEPDSDKIVTIIENVIKMNKNEYKTMKNNAINYFKKNYEKEMLMKKMDKYLFEGGNKYV